MGAADATFVYLERRMLPCPRVFQREGRARAKSSSDPNSAEIQGGPREEESPRASSGGRQAEEERAGGSAPDSAAVQDAQVR